MPSRKRIGVPAGSSNWAVATALGLVLAVAPGAAAQVSPGSPEEPASRAVTRAVPSRPAVVPVGPTRPITERSQTQPPRGAKPAAKPETDKINEEKSEDEKTEGEKGDQSDQKEMPRQEEKP